MDEESETRRPKRQKTERGVILQKKTERMMQLAVMGLNSAEIGRVIDVPERTVRGRLERFKHVFDELENVKDFDEAKSDILKAVQLTCLKSAISKDKLERSSTLQCMQSFDIANKSARLENDLSTENIATNIFAKVSVNITKDE